jgi:outer membrane protein assembly factor BamA
MGRQMFLNASRLLVVGLSVPGVIALGPATASAQPEPVEPPRTRAEAIQAERREKVAELWPERESPLVARVNQLVERGFKEGLDSGEGADGPQIVLGGMRSGQGFSFGVGYRRAGLWRDRLSYRATARGTINLAYLLDFDLDVKSFRSEKTFVDIYTKFEHSPHSSYYGQGNNSLESSQTSYLFDDVTSDVNAGFEPVRFLKLGLTGGYMAAHTGPPERDDEPSTEDVFGPAGAPGLGDDTQFARWGAFVTFDHRDRRSGPRSGGFYGARFRHFADVDRHRYSFRQASFEFQQYVPYFNKTRVIALRAATILSFTTGSQQVPIYLQPTLGGNNDLRSFARYRFYDDHAIYLGIEHRWFAFTGLDTAIFLDAGKVTPQKADINLSGLKTSGGIGFRFRVADAVVSRIDFAAGREGFRWMWTFNDIFKPRW